METTMRDGGAHGEVKSASSESRLKEIHKLSNERLPYVTRILPTQVLPEYLMEFLPDGRQDKGQTQVHDEGDGS